MVLILMFLLTDLALLDFIVRVAGKLELISGDLWGEVGNTNMGSLDLLTLTPCHWS